MATRGRTSFQKRQKEMARKERQQRKVERRDHRRMARSVVERTPPQDPAETSGDQAESSGEPAETPGHSGAPLIRGHSTI